MIGIISFVAFTLLVAFIAYFATRSTDETSADGYFLGGRSLGAVVIAGSLLLTNLSTEQIVGLNGQAYNEGILVMVWETLAALAMVVTAIFLLPRYLKGGISTVPQYLEERYDTMTKTLVSGLFLTGYVVVLLPIVLYSGAVAFTAMFDLPEMLGINKTESIWLCVWAIGIIGSIYAIFGGLKAVAVSDTINAIGLLIGGLMIPVFGLMAIGDGNMFDGISTLTATHPEKFNAIGGPTDSVPFATIFTGMMLVQLFYWGTNQAIIQRALAASSLKEGQKGLLLASFIKILGPLLVVLPGIIAWHMFGGTLDNGDEAYPTLVRKVLPAPLLGFFAAVIFGAILSSFNSALNSSVTLFGLDIYKEYFNADADEKTVVKAGKTFGIILAILAMFIAPFIANAPDGLFGWLQKINGCYSIPILTIIVVGFLTKYVPAKAAKIGLALGVILYCISTFFIEPYKIDQNINAHKSEIVSSTSALTSALANIPYKGEEAATDLISSISAINNASIIDADMTGLISKNFSALKDLYKENNATIPAELKAANGAFSGKVDFATKTAYPHFLHVMAFLFLLNSIIMLIIGKISPRDTPFEQKYTEQVEIDPWKYVKPAGVVICILVIAVYIYFS